MSNELKIQALQWYVRMRSSDVSSDERQAYDNWLLEDETHKEVYNAIEREWQELDNLESWAVEEMRLLEDRIIPAKRKRNFLIGFSGLTIAAVTVAIIFVLSPFILQTQIHQYETAKGEQRKIVLEDGSRIHLNSASSVTVQFNSEAREIDLLEGEGLFDVAHERKRPFVVRVRDSKIVAVGTSFSVYYKNDEIAVTVLEGRIAIMPADKTTEMANMGDTPDSKKASVLLEPDRQARVNEKGQVADVKIVDADKLTAWNRGLIVLDGKPLREVAEEMSRYIVGQVQVASGVPDYPVTGVIKIRDQETMLQLLSEVVPVTPVRQSSQLTMLYPSPKEPEFGNSD